MLVEQQFPQIGLVSEAYNGKSAVEKAVEMKPDIVFLDIEMPLINGIQAGSLIREQFPECILIYLTAFAEFQYAKQAISLGAMEFLLKPIEETELNAVLNKALEKIEKRKREDRDIHTRMDPVTEQEGEDLLSSVSGDRSSAAVLEARRYIDRYFMDDISVESIAGKFQISPNHFNRIFKQTFQIPCKEYIINVRVEKAKEFLLSPALTVKEVGGLVGYQDPNYFAKVFRKKTGMTPKEYRNQMLFS